MNKQQTLQFLLFSLSLVILILTPTHAGDTSTTVYKITHPDGSITFSDVEQSNSEEIHVKPITTVPALVIPKHTYSPSTNQAKTIEGYYDSLEIISPKSDSALYSGNGDINIKVAITPPLRTDDRLQFQLDDTNIATQKELKLTIMAVNRGSHRINVNIINQSGTALLSTESKVTIHRPIAR